MKPPHAHISNIKGDRKLFGQDKQHLRRYKSIRNPIQSRPLVNITCDLINKPEFQEVRNLKKRIQQIRALKSSVGIDMSEPRTYQMSQRLSRDARRDKHEFSQHLIEIANMQRRIGCAGDVSLL